MVMVICHLNRSCLSMLKWNLNRLIINQHQLSSWQWISIWAKHIRIDDNYLFVLSLAKVLFVKVCLSLINETRSLVEHVLKPPDLFIIVQSPIGQVSN